MVVFQLSKEYWAFCGDIRLLQLEGLYIERWDWQSTVKASINLTVTFTTCIKNK